MLLPIIERHIPIIADEAVEAEFGTGALKMTPGHDPVDFEIGQRHGLPAIVAIAGDGTMNAEAGPYEGMDRFEARERIVADLRAARADREDRDRTDIRSAIASAAARSSSRSSASSGS